VSRGIALPFCGTFGTRWGWVVSSTPRPTLPPGKTQVPIVQEAGWAPGPVWKGGKSRPHQDLVPDRPAHSQSLYWLSYPFLLWNILTHSMVHSRSWEANWFAASQEIPHISRNPKVHYNTHKHLPPVPIWPAQSSPHTHIPSPGDPS
jgi:hypothetical protein